MVSDFEFYEFFRGLSDGESNFQITQDKRGNCVFKFKFRIEMHINDRPLLIYIRNRLGLGKIYPKDIENVLPEKDKLSSTWEVTSLSELFKIINILDNHPLNTIKQLDYLAWREAYFIYAQYREGKLVGEPTSYPIDVLDQILILKNSMNKSRTNFIQSPHHKINVTPYWLLGLIEGEGSFFAVQNLLTQHFELGLNAIHKPVLEEVYNFLMNLIPNDMISLALLGLEKPIQIRTTNKIGGLSNQMCIVKFSHMTYINKVFIPFFEKLTFFSKKENSFNDWKTLALIKMSGKHLTPEGRIICNALSKRMNDWTYFTDKGIQNKLAIEQLNLQIQQLLADTTVKVNNSRGSYVKFQIFPQEEVNQTNSLYNPMSIQEVADFFQVSIKTISRRSIDGKPLVHQNKNFYIKRVNKSSIEG